MNLPTISVVVVNYNGKRHLEPCFNSLLRQNYPADHVEIIMVDNNSTDGSLELMAQRFPTVKIVSNARNVGFAGAVNTGAAYGTGEYVALINNDAYADPDWLIEMVNVLQAHQHEQVVCVGAKMLDWYGKRIDFVGGGMNFYGLGDQFYHQLPVDSVRIEPQELMFACGGAMLVHRQIFIDLGGLDPDYFAYFEDVDFGWRLWLYGYRVRLAPKAVVHHRQHATANMMYGHQVGMLLERNAIATIIKNYDEEHLNQLLPAALLLLIKRSFILGEGTFDRREFDMRQRDRTTPQPTIEVPKTMLSALVGVSDLIDDFPNLWAKRQKIQSERVRPDSEIFKLFRRPLTTNNNSLSYFLFQDALLEAFDIRSVFESMPMTRVLILANNPLTDNLAGPGIRAVEMARYLGQSCHVTLAAPTEASISIPNVECVGYEPNNQEIMYYLVSHSDVVILQGPALYFYPVIRALHKIIVVDLYDPFHLENLEFYQPLPIAEARERLSHDIAVINEQLQYGDFFICASERQRDFWLGALGSLERLSPENYGRDATLRQLIDVVPFGLPPEPPAHVQPVIKGVVPGIEADDTVLLWGGGIWDWLDPFTIIRAMALVREQRPDIKLFFLGQHHPNPETIPEMASYMRSVELAKELGLLGETVFFNDRWVPYAERQNYLLEADLGVSAHLNHIETRFAFRTRLLDCIWAGLPMVVAEGDTLAATVAELQLGEVVPTGDHERWAQAILAMSSLDNRRESYAERFRVAQQRFTWPEVLKPILNFCQRPRYAADKQDRAAVAPTATLAPAPLAPSVERRMNELENIIETKNQHIEKLEEHIRRLESGKVMRTLGLIKRIQS